MPQENVRSQSGAFGPDELQLFDRVLKKLQKTSLVPAQRELLAQRVMANYMSGITDEDELLTVSKLPR